MISNIIKARIAGLCYLVVVITGIFSLAYVPSQLIDWDNAATTTNNIKTSETLFRAGILSSMVCYIFFLLLPITLYKLLKPVQTFYAKLMVLLAVTSVPISLINLQNKFALLTLISGEKESIFTREEIQSQVMFYLQQYNHGILIVSVFWGLWLLPFGYLVYKSGFLPKIIGLLLMIGCFGYLINFIGNILLKNYAELGVAKFISIPASLGEIGICLWLLIVGIKSRKTFENDI